MVELVTSCATLADVGGTLATLGGSSRSHNGYGVDSTATGTSCISFSHDNQSPFRLCVWFVLCFVIAYRLHLQHSTKKSFVNNFFQFLKIIFWRNFLKFIRRTGVGVVYICVCVF
jgi:hypothetical protein